ncbi:MAG: formylglycine-generating enzyme family protein [Saprospiraceae bacterium]|nr:formylglycine-generating enzyme family protein [Saprospiraceae bacterium]
MKNHYQPLPGLAQPFAMIAVPGGTFDMGGESWLNDALPVHPVELDDFWIGEYPVTQALWTAVLGEANNPSRFKGADRPVETVSWEEIDQSFLPALNRLTENTRPPRTAYRLPTEAEWEYAARGGLQGKNESLLYAGSDILDEVGWYDDNSHGETKPVGLKLPNQLGLYDMSGNVWEWCNDWHGSEYYQECLDKGTINNPRGAEKGGSRVLRGGSWIHFAQLCRSSNRDLNAPTSRDIDVGFRLVLVSLPV